jgi:hypothetical protein
LREPHAVFRKLIEVRRLDLLLSVATEIAVAEIVGQDENDVRFLGTSGERGAEIPYSHE